MNRPAGENRRWIEGRPIPPLSVVIVDDHEIVRAGLAALLASDRDIRVVGTAPDGRAGLDLIRDLGPDIAVIDYSMPDMSGTEMCATVTAQYPDIAVIMLTTFVNDEVLYGAIDAGAKAFVVKDVDSNDLKRAIKAVGRGEAVLDPKVAGRVARWAKRGRFGPQDQPLSTREIDVLRFVARGATNREISAALALSENTVRTYLKRLLFKLDCHNRAEAAAIAARRGLL